MKNLVTVKNGLLITTDLLIAQALKRRPSDVKHAIRKLECPDDFRQRNFTLTSYLDAQGKTRPCYEITRDGFFILIMSFTGKKAMDIKLKYIEAFNTMESQLYGFYERLNCFLDIYNTELLIVSNSARNMQRWKKRGKELRLSIEQIKNELQLSLDLEH